MTPEMHATPETAPADVGTLAREHTADVVERLKELLGGDDGRLSLAAAAMLLDRGWGKVEGRAEPAAAPLTVIRAPNVSEDTESWLQQYAPPATR
jgi:hypothetical protein